jgi:hypothetical protein
MKYLSLIILLCLFGSCTSKNDLPRGILEPNKMRDVFWDYIRADVYATEYLKKDSSVNAVTENLKLQEKVFKLHKTTKEQFYKSYTYYSNHKELMGALMDSIISKNQQEKTKTKPAVELKQF